MTYHLWDHVWEGDTAYKVVGASPVTMVERGCGYGCDPRERMQSFIFALKSR